jgi:hypothetical protein
MSLDVYLYVKGASGPEGSGIYVRENGATRELSRSEWDERFPGVEPVVTLQEDETETVFSANITHNLGKMADAAALQDALWEPETIPAVRAEDLIPALEAGLRRLQDSPHFFRKLNPANGWGNYEGLVEFVESYLAACRKWPHAEIRVSR